jgi:hypothetical protein
LDDYHNPELLFRVAENSGTVAQWAIEKQMVDLDGNATGHGLTDIVSGKSADMKFSNDDTQRFLDGYAVAKWAITCWSWRWPFTRRAWSIGTVGTHGRSFTGRTWSVWSVTKWLAISSRTVTSGTRRPVSVRAVAYRPWWSVSIRTIACGSWRTITHGAVAYRPWRSVSSAVCTRTLWRSTRRNRSCICRPRSIRTNFLVAIARTTLGCIVAGCVHRQSQLVIPKSLHSLSSIRAGADIA